MLNKNEILPICLELLKLYGQTSNVSIDEIKNLHIFRAQRYAFTSVYSFQYKNIKYYISDDYSLGDNPIYVEDVLRDIEPMLKGVLLKNPIPQSDGAIFASGLDGVEYYMWKCIG